MTSEISENDYRQGFNDGAFRTYLVAAPVGMVWGTVYTIKSNWHKEESWTQRGRLFTPTFKLFDDMTANQVRGALVAAAITLPSFLIASSFNPKIR